MSYLSDPFPLSLTECKRRLRLPLGAQAHPRWNPAPSDRQTSSRRHWPHVRFRYAPFANGTDKGSRWYEYFEMEFWSNLLNDFLDDKPARPIVPERKAKL